MQSKLEQIKDEAVHALNDVLNIKELEDIRVKFLGKKGLLTQILRDMKSLSDEEKPHVGKIANEIREYIEEALKEKKNSLDSMLLNQRLENENIDITLNIKKASRGGYHPLNLVLDEVKEFFQSLGFDFCDGPEVELDYYNFEALNIPKDHPARDEQDTFYVNESIVLRTHTSPTQIRYMECNKPPIRMITPGGRVYRTDTVDATHYPVFHQIEGLVIDKGISMADLRGVLDLFAKKMFGSGTKTKFRPHHFQFTEPSAEVDATCSACGGSGCRVCSNSGWIEILGAGMVHPKVLEYGGINPEIYSGFAFGVGLERITNIKYGIDDIRLLYENDIRFIKQFQ